MRPCAAARICSPALRPQGPVRCGVCSVGVCGLWVCGVGGVWCGVRLVWGVHAVGYSC